uniref:Uncharacterized protein n=1 Tax=Oryza meridionalis TaxID=40149 RepID=A0A0E0DX69_9ORYZ
KKTRPKNANRARLPGCLLVSLNASRAPAAPPSLVPVAVGRPPRRAPRAAAGPPRRRDDRLLLSGVVDVSQSPCALPSPPLPPQPSRPGPRSYPRPRQRRGDPPRNEPAQASSRRSWLAGGYSQSQLYPPPNQSPPGFQAWHIIIVLIA